MCRLALNGDRSHAGSVVRDLGDYLGGAQKV
jgi:hypothetical protein